MINSGVSSEFERLRVHLRATITRADVAKVLVAIRSEREAWEWFTRARIPFPFTVEILRALRDGEYLAFAPARLTGRGEALAHELNVSPAPDMRCPTCGGSGTDWRDGVPDGFHQGLAETYSRYLEIFGSRPRGEAANLDQGAMTPESLYRRLALAVHHGDIAGREIVTLGDDDLASIALALTGLPEKVTVLEIDTRICDYIETVAKAYRLNIRVIRQDLTAGLPTCLPGTFDTFLCDPPETEAGLLLFVEKGLALLKPGDAHAGYFGATVLEASLSKWKRWQTRLLNRHEIAFTHILAPFTTYESWPDEKPLGDLPPLAQISPRPWYRYAFYRLETLPAFKPHPDFQMEHSQVFYFDEESYYEAF
jgi:N4-bis(aminopropyl)spermidine synthase